MKVFVTGVGDQLVYDVTNELAKRSIDGIGSDITSQYSGIQDGSAVTSMPYSFRYHEKEICRKNTC